MSDEVMTYRQRIDEAVANSQRLQEFLAALRAEVPNGSLPKELRSVEAGLASGWSADRWLASEALAPYLPLALGFANVGPRSEDDQRYLAQCLIPMRERRRPWLRALAYPLLVAVLSIVLVAILSMTVFPIFAEMFEEFQIRVPTSTDTVLWIGDQWLRNPYTLAVVLLSGFLLMGAAWRLATWLFERYESVSLLGLRYQGSRRNLLAMSRWTRVLADLLESGAPLGEALRGAGWASRTQLYLQQSQSLAQAVEAANANVLPAIHPAKVFLPPTVVQTLNLAEGPARVRLLKRLALVYADRADHRVKGRMEALGPIGIVAVGLLVGYVLFALLAPMMSLLSSLSG